jgi:hypothetical protein
MSATQHMKMKMENGLSCVSPGIRHDPIAGAPQAFQGCHLRAAHQQSREQRFILRPQVVNGCDMSLRDHQRMDRRLRIDVVKGDRVLILLNKLRRNLLFRDLTKQTLAHIDSMKQLSTPMCAG